jgi:hypothetical protein
MLLKRPEPPRRMGADRPNSGLGSRIPESNRSFGTNPSSERKPFSDWIQPLGQTTSPPTGSMPTSPSNQIRPASGLPLGNGNLNPNPTRLGSSRSEMPRSETLRSGMPRLDLPRLELPRSGQSEDRNKPSNSHSSSQWDTQELGVASNPCADYRSDQNANWNICP